MTAPENAPTDTPRLEVRALTKRFPGVAALDNVSLTLRAGEVLAVIGENGAGKSTLMKILAGVQAADDGEIFVDGNPARIDSVRAATALGIAWPLTPSARHNSLPVEGSYEMTVSAPLAINSARLPARTTIGVACVFR